MVAARNLAAVIRILGVLALGVGSLVITAASAVYFDGEELAPFVIEKLPLPLEDLYLVALQIHVVAAAFALPACLLLQWSGLLRRARALHRWLGRLTGGVVLLALAPSGFYLSLFAKGGLAGTLGFALSGAIVVVAMVQAIRTAREGDFLAHRRQALHVLAQLSVAVSSRAMLYAFDAFGAEPERAYLVSLWLPVVASAGAVELLVRRRNSRTLPRRNHEALHLPRHVDHRQSGLRDAARV